MWPSSRRLQAGISLEKAILSTALLNPGGVTGALVLARVIDRWRPGPVLAAAYLVAAICTYGIGQMTLAPFAALMTMVFLVDINVSRAGFTKYIDGAKTRRKELL